MSIRLGFVTSEVHQLVYLAFHQAPHVVGIGEPLLWPLMPTGRNHTPAHETDRSR